MTFWTCLFVLLLAASTAGAEVTIRSGEHATFSRLVFTAPIGTAWSLDEGDAQATITLDTRDERFDTSDIFTRIPRTRLLSATDLGDGRLELGLNCACPLDAFQLNNRVFVIDIQDPAQEAETAAASPEEEDAPALSGAFRLPLLTGTAPWEGIVPPLGFRDVDTSGDRLVSTVGAPDQTDRVAEARARLLEEVARAGDQGLIDVAAQDHTDRNETVAVPSQAEPVSPVEPLPQEATVPPPPALNMTARTSVDDALSDTIREMLGVPPETHCIPSDALNVAAWKGSHGFRRTMGALNRDLYGEFDRIDADKATELVQVYVSYGLGAEALFVLQMLEDQTDVHRRLRTMAEVLEFGSARGPDAFLDQAQCDTAAALWSVLASTPGDMPESVNSNALLQAFDTLPSDLRLYLGPLLSEKLRESRQFDIAEDVMRIVTRGSRAEDSTVKMELSHLALERGDTLEVAANLDAIIEDNVPPSPEALVSLIDLRISGEQMIAPDEIVLLGAYALEFRGSDLSDDLQRALAMALAHAGQYAEAMAEMGRLPPDAVAPGGLTVHGFVLSRLAARASDAAFLRFAVPYFSRTSEHIDEATGIEIARRFLSLGFPEMAQSLIDQRQTARTPRDARVLLAELALSEQRPRNAIAQLLDLEGDDVDRLRARAYAELSEFDRAKTLYSRLEETRSASEMALLDRDWNFLQDSGTGRLPEIARDQVAEDTIDFSVPGLATSGTALANSRETATLVDALLEDFPFDAD